MKIKRVHFFFNGKPSASGKYCNSEEMCIWIGCSLFLVLFIKITPNNYCVWILRLL